jgi:hypothetical protein
MREKKRIKIKICFMKLGYGVIGSVQAINRNERIMTGFGHTGIFAQEAVYGE